jgi:hypothetical protein
MTKLLSPRLLLAMAVLLMPGSAFAQQGVRVHVVDSISRSGIRGATITALVDGMTIRAITDSAGIAVLQNGQSGVYRIHVTALGYRTQDTLRVEVAANRLTLATVSMLPQPIPVRPVEAKAQRSRALEQHGFYRRKEDHNGIFIERAEIERSSGRLLSDLFRRVPGARMVTATSGMAVWFQGSENISVPGRLTLCGPRVILDGIEQNTGSDSRFPTPIDEIAAKHDLEGIEIYRRPSQLPSRFGGAMSACGVIVLWTRR